MENVIKSSFQLSWPLVCVNDGGLLLLGRLISLFSIFVQEVSQIFFNWLIHCLLPHQGVTAAPSWKWNNWFIVCFIKFDFFFLSVPCIKPMVSNIQVFCHQVNLLSFFWWGQRECSMLGLVLHTTYAFNPQRSLEPRDGSKPKWE